MQGAPTPFTFLSKDVEGEKKFVCEVCSVYAVCVCVGVCVCGCVGVCVAMLFVSWGERKALFGWWCRRGWSKNETQV